MRSVLTGRNADERLLVLLREVKFLLCVLIALVVLGVFVASVHGHEARGSAGVMEVSR